jgi:hypothetical protein
MAQPRRPGAAARVSVACPLRLHVASTTQANWTDTRFETNPRGRVWPYRLVTALSGEVRLRMTNGRTSRLSTQGDTGSRLARKSETDDLVQLALLPDGAVH